MSEHETLGNVECYDPETDRWVVDVIPQMNYRRSGVGMTIIHTYTHTQAHNTLVHTHNHTPTHTLYVYTCTCTCI